MKTEREKFISKLLAVRANADITFNYGNNHFYDPANQLAWELWQAAKADAVPDGFVLVKRRNMIGNPNVDWLQAPKWARYWLKDGHSNKYWWSSIRPVKDMDLQAFCWRGDYFAEEAPSFDFLGQWDKSLTSRKAMIEAQEQSK